MRTSQADEGHWDTWILTTDARVFYEKVGYEVIAEGRFGQNNPKWTGGPLSVYLVSIYPDRHSRWCSLEYGSRWCRWCENVVYDKLT